MNIVPSAAFAALVLLAVAAVGVSVNILLRGRIYAWLKPQSRPRRWVLFALLFVFVTFVVCFPVWLAWPQSFVGKALLLLFAVAFFAVCITLKWFTGAVDLMIKRRGWPLR